MSRITTLYLWDLTQGLQNRFLQVFALVCIMGGSALLAAAPGRETLPLILIQTILFFGSLFACLVGWGSGQQAREQGAFLFAQPIGAGELILGKLLGTGSWFLLILLLFMGPVALRAGMPGTLAALGMLSLGFLLVCVLAGLLIGLLARPVSGLLAVLLVWAVAVAGWELALLVISEMAWIQRMPGVFVTLLLVNPAGAFRVSALLGLQAVPFDADELETGRLVFQNIRLIAAAIFVLWLAVLFIVTRWRLGRQEY